MEIVQKIPVLSFRNTSVLYYEVSANHAARLRASAAFQQNAVKLAKRERYKGMVTVGAIKRMRKAITLLIQSTPTTYKWNPVIQRSVSHQLSFITVTMPPSEKSTDAKYCQKHLLEPLLRHFRLKNGMKSYIWKLELQDNGSVHYHITTDFIIHHSDLKNYWNGLLRKNGMLKEFEAKYGHDNPNSTDVHQVGNIRNMEAYLVKYITKAYQNESAVNGKVWDCSMNLKACDYYKIELDTLTHQLIRTLQKTQQVTTTYFEKAISLNFHTTDYYAFFTENVRNNFFTYLNTVRSWTKESASKTLAPKATLRTMLGSISESTTKLHNVGKQLCWNFYTSLSAAWNQPNFNDDLSNWSKA